MGLVQDNLELANHETPYLKVFLDVGALKYVLEQTLPTERHTEYVDRYLSLERANAGSRAIVGCTFARVQEVFQALYDAGILQEGRPISIGEFLKEIQRRTHPRGRDIETYEILSEIFVSASVEIKDVHWLSFVRFTPKDEILPPSPEQVAHKPPPRKPTRSSPGF